MNDVDIGLFDSNYLCSPSTDTSSTLHFRAEREKRFEFRIPECIQIHNSVLFSNRKLGCFVCILFYLILSRTGERCSDARCCRSNRLSVHDDRCRWQTMQCRFGHIYRTIISIDWNGWVEIVFDANEEGISEEEKNENDTHEHRTTSATIYIIPSNGRHRKRNEQKAIEQQIQNETKNNVALRNIPVTTFQLHMLVARYTRSQTCTKETVQIPLTCRPAAPKTQQQKSGQTERCSRKMNYFRTLFWDRTLASATCVCVSHYRTAIERKTPGSQQFNSFLFFIFVLFYSLDLFAGATSIFFFDLNLYVHVVVDSIGLSLAIRFGILYI